MKPMIYLWRTTFKNQLKMSLRKPTNLLAILFVCAYAVLMLWSFTVMANDTKMQSIDMAPVLGFFVIMYTPLNLATYARRKGIIFKKCDVNFLFTAPVSPKIIMLFAKVRTAWADILLSVFVFLGGIVIFHISFWKMLLYLAFTVIVKQVLETSLVLILYSSESLTKVQRKMISVAIYVIILVLVLGIAAYILTHDFKVLSARTIMENPFFQMIPLIGWEISFVFLLFSEMTVINIIGSMLYLSLAVVLLFMAKRMTCKGEYYEDAMKFADDYEEAMKKNKKGEVAVIGRKKKYLKNSITYKGTGAKAIFYRQLLEYKKNRFFIFGFISLLYLIVGIVIGVATRILPELSEIGEIKCLIVPAAMIYFAFILSSYRTKWGKELEQPLTFLIPDSAIKKLWYATLVEHIRAACDGLLMTIPAAIGMKLEPVYVILTVLFCVLLNAGKLYIELLIKVMLGKNVIQFISTLVKLFFECIFFTIGIVGGVFGGFVTGFSDMLPIVIGMNAMLFVTAFVMAMLSSLLFDRMDYTE